MKEEIFWQKIKQEGLSLTLVGENLVVGPKKQITDELLEEIRKNKSEIISHLKIENFFRRVKNKPREPVTFDELIEVDMPELQLVESAVWFHPPGTFEAASKITISAEERNKKVALVKEVFPGSKVIEIKELSMKTNGKEAQGQFKHQQDTARYHRFFLEVEKEIIGYIYVPKEQEVPEKIVLLYKE